MNLFITQQLMKIKVSSMSRNIRGVARKRFGGFRFLGFYIDFGRVCMHYRHLSPIHERIHWGGGWTRKTPIRNIL